MTLKSEYDDYLKANIIYPTGSFEVDGIVYTPPWECKDPGNGVPVHYQPMIDLKEDHVCHPGSCYD